MTEKTFMTQMQRLADCFGAKYYIEDRRRLIWKRVQDLSDEWMVRTIDGFVGYSRQAPLLAEFEEQVSKETDRLWELQKRQPMAPAVTPGADGFVCSECDNRGIIFGPQLPLEVLGKCRCKYGRARRENYPTVLRAGLKAL